MDNLMYHSLKEIECFPPWHRPEAFKAEYPNTRIIIDATEFKVGSPSSLLFEFTTFSAYKNTKVLVGIALYGAVSFLLPAYEGFVSDRKLSGLLRLETK